MIYYCYFTGSLKPLPFAYVQVTGDHQMDCLKDLQMLEEL